MLWIEADWEFSEINTVNVYTYMSSEIEMSIADSNKFPNILERILTSCAKKCAAKKSYEEKGEPNIWRSVSINDTKANYGYVYYQNESQNSTLYE